MALSRLPNIKIAPDHDVGRRSLAQKVPFTFPFRGRGNGQLLCLVVLFLVGMFFLVLSFCFSGPGFRSAVVYPGSVSHQAFIHGKYLYWGYRIDCPGKHCETCAGLGHQESSLRCALEEALVLDRIFVLPSRMCINQQHNDRSLLHASSKTRMLESWDTDTCSMESLYDLKSISQKVRVILDSSNEWILALAKAREMGAVVHVKGISRLELKQNDLYNDAVIINRTASPLAWFVECKDRKNHSSVLLPYSFLPTMAAKPIQMAAVQIRKQLGDYDAIHVRRGDKLKVRKDRFGMNRTLLPHLNRDTQPQAIMHRIANWIPAGRTIYIASNERKPGYFVPLTSKYTVMYSLNFTNILDGVVHNNYQLFMLDRLVLMGAKTFVKTFKEEPSDLSLTDDEKKRIRAWEIPVYTFDDSPDQ